MNGQLSESTRLNGFLSNDGALHGVLGFTGALQGTIAGINGLSGELQAVQGIAGNMTIPTIITENEEYQGSYEITPKSAAVTVLETKDKIMRDDVTVFKIPRWNTSNNYGTTVYIGEINGN